MSSRVEKKASARAHAAELRAQQQREEQRRRRLLVVAGAVGLVLVLVLGLVVAKLAGAGSGGGTTTASGQASASLLRSVQSVPEATYDEVGRGSARSAPVVIDAPSLAEGGKPRVLYVGAEFCPFCAAERWPMTLALSRFGSFSKLGTTHSASEDVYPDTASLSFHGSAYRSDVLAFTGVETKTNEREGGDYAPLDTLSADDQALVDKYDAPPYTQSAGGIPFIVFGGKVISTGATFDPQVLAGKTQAQIAAALAEPDDPITQAVVGSANVLTAAICRATGGQPAAVCDSSGVTTAAPAIKAAG